jgi:hypothetical protein
MPKSSPIAVSPIAVGVQGTVEVSTGQAITTNATDESFDRYSSRTVYELEALRNEVDLLKQQYYALSSRRTTTYNDYPESFLLFGG